MSQDDQFPTSEQVDRAARAGWDFDAQVSEMFGKPVRLSFDDLPDWARETHLDKARAMLRAAGPDDRPDPCKMTHTPPFDFGQCETHDTTFPLGGSCKWHKQDSIAAVLQQEADEQRGLKVRAALRAEQAEAALAQIQAEREQGG
ncbi:hypothetical protein ACXR2T_07960 [Leucobacter sp. HY1910]